MYVCRFNTPLHYAVQKIRTETVKYILKHEVYICITCIVNVHVCKCYSIIIECI